MKKAFQEKLSQSSVIVVAHESSIGPPQELRNFLLNKKVKKLLYIAHPLIYLKEHYKDSSRYSLYKNGNLLKTHTGIHWRVPDAFLYVKDVIYTVIWSLKSNEKYDIYIGADPLNAFAGIILKKLRKVKKVVYYSIDYTPQRFNNGLLNYVYHLIDKMCCYMVDLNWVGTNRTMDARIANGISKDKIAPTIIVPDGTHVLNLKKANIKNVRWHELVYVGYLLDKQGIELVLDSLVEIQKKISDIKFIIIGKGPHKASLINNVKKLRLNTVVSFKGFIKDDVKLQRILTTSGIGVAPYVEDKNSFTYYSTAGKPVLYLGCGLPVIITDVPPIAREIQKRKAGVMISYNKEQFINAIYMVLKNKNVYSKYRENAKSFGDTLDWLDIFEEGFNKTIRCFNTSNRA